MTRRFSRYRFALKSIRSTSSPDDPVTAPNNTPLGNFQKYRKGDVVPSYTRDANSLPEAILKVAINPFGLALDVANQVAVPFSQRAATAGGNGIATASNHSAVTDTTLDLRGFIPAKVIASDIPDTAPTGATETSQITGVRYKRSGARSFTYPYGKKTGELLEAEVRTSVTTALRAAFGANTRVSFKSEQLSLGALT